MPTLREIINRNVFVVPGYQRGYSWGVDQLNDFWRDIEWILEGKTHFTGMLTLRRTGNNTPYEKIEVVDGQQRLTTSFLLLHCLLKHAKAKNGFVTGEDVELIHRDYIRGSYNGESYLRLQYESRDDNEFLAKLLNSKVESLDAIGGFNIYRRNLTNALKYFEAHVGQLNSDAINKTFENLTTRLIFQVEYVENQFDVCAMFESINYRGKKLTQFEVLKNRILYIGERLIKTNQEKDVFAAKVQKAWSSAYSAFGKGKQPLEEDDFLKIHSVMYFGGVGKKRNALDNKLFKEVFALERVLNNAEKPITMDYIEKYVENIESSAFYWAVQNVVTDDKDIESLMSVECYQWIGRISRLSDNPFKPTILATINLKGSGKIDNNDMLSLLKAIERFIFIVYEVCGKGGKDSADEILIIGNDLYLWKGENPVAKFVENLEEKLCGYDVHDNYKGIYNRQLVATESQTRFTDAKKADLMGWKKWSGIKYFLTEYEYSCGQIFIENKRYASESDKLNVEHIMPVNAKKAEGWKHIVAQKDESKLLCIINDLGNLILISESMNKAIKDKSFEVKKNHYKNSDLKSFANLDGIKNWSIDEINKRSLDLLEFMMERWDMPWSDDSEFRLAEDILAVGFTPQVRKKKNK